jgi:hypothetical protein
MHYAIFDTGPGYLQWMGEAADPREAIQALHDEGEDLGDNALDPSEDFIVVYELQPSEVARIDDLLLKGEHIDQDFASEGQEFTWGQVQEIVGL